LLWFATGINFLSWTWKKWNQYLSGHKVLWLVTQQTENEIVKGYKGSNRRNRTHGFFSQRLLNHSSTNESTEVSNTVYLSSVHGIQLCIVGMQLIY
jgi:hypothetical protein